LAEKTELDFAKSKYILRNKSKRFMKYSGMVKQDLLNCGRLLNSSEVLFLGGFKSHTTLIKMEKAKKIKVATRIGNQKRYAPAHIKRVFGL